MTDKIIKFPREYIDHTKREADVLLAKMEALVSGQAQANNEAERRLAELLKRKIAMRKGEA